MSKSTDFRVALIDPQRVAGSLDQLTKLIPEITEFGDVPRHFCELPLLAVIEDSAGLPHWEATLFLAYTALRSNSVCGDTVRTYAEALLPWLRYLRDKRIDLVDVDEEVHGLYRAKVAHARHSSEQERYASATVNLRVVVPELLHLWGEERGVFSSPLGLYLLDECEGRHARWTGVGRAGPKARTRPRTRVIKRIPMSLSDEEIQRLVRFSPMPYRLIWKWAIATGFRRFEVCNLARNALPTPEQISLNEHGLVSFSILRKGGRQISVYAPTALIEETNWYILTERPKPSDPLHSSRVFLSDDGCPISRQMLSKRFRQAADGLGSKATLHHLRHTFAIKVYGSLEHYRLSGEEINPLKALQVLLGHAHMETSEIYTQSLSIANSAVMKALDALFGAVE